MRSSSRPSSAVAVAGGFFGRGGVGIEVAAALGFPLRHEGPADFLRVAQEAGLDGFVL